MDFSDLSHFATMQVKLYVLGFLVVANPNNSVKNGKNLVLLYTKTFFYFFNKFDFT